MDFWFDEDGSSGILHLICLWWAMNWMFIIIHMLHTFLKILLNHLL